VLKFSQAALVVIVGLLVLGILWSIMITQVQAERDEEMRQVHQHQKRLAEAVTLHVKETIAMSDQLARVVQDEVLRRPQLPPTLYSGISIAGEDGYVKDHAFREPLHYVAKEEYFRKLRESAKDVFLVRTIQPSVLTSHPQMVVSRRITRPDGSFAGVVNITLTADYFSRYYERLTATEAETIILVVNRETVLGIKVWKGFQPDLTLVHASVPETYGIAIDKIERNTVPVRFGNAIWSSWDIPDNDMSVIVGSNQTGSPGLEHHLGKYYVTGAVLSVLIMVLTGLVTWLTWRASQAVALLKASERKANAANAVKSSFVGKISHDLRTPLNGIVGFADLIRQSGSSDRDRTYASHIYDSATHLHSLLNMILDITKIEAGAEALAKSDVELVPVVRNLAEIHALPASTKGLELSLEISRDTPFVLRCDEHRLRQILGNILHNAVKFTEHGKIVFAIENSDKGVVFTIRDNGPGIPPEEMSHLFEMFHHIHRSGSREHAGIGLGLAIAKELVELHGGEIEVESTVGVGTCFRITLPR
jgi:two-component system sensor histidine kinase BarA